MYLIIHLYIYIYIYHSFGKISFLHDWRAKRQKLDTEPIPSIEAKKKGGRKVLLEPPNLPDGRKCVRTIRFERSEGESKFVILS